MSYKNVHKNLTPAARKRGREVAHRIRQERRNARLVQVKIMRNDGMTKADIARHFKISWETVNRDCKAIENADKRVINVSIIDAIFTVVRDEIAGKIHTLEARQQVQELIALATPRPPTNPDILSGLRPGVLEEETNV